MNQVFISLKVFRITVILTLIIASCNSGPQRNDDTAKSNYEYSDVIIGNFKFPKQSMRLMELKVEGDNQTGHLVSNDITIRYQFGETLADNPCQYEELIGLDYNYFIDTLSEQYILKTAVPISNEDSTIFSWICYPDSNTLLGTGFTFNLETIKYPREKQYQIIKFMRTVGLRKD